MMGIKDTSTPASQDHKEEPLSCSVGHAVINHCFQGISMPWHIEKQILKN
jgi:hypothetical protein